jgi:hypothetical protein
VLRCAFCTNEIDSTPPPIVTVMPSAMICLAAMAMAISPEAHWRSTVIPATAGDRPARRTAWRAVL